MPPIDIPSDAASANPTGVGGLASWRNRHRGATMLVCGCGSSLSLLTEPHRVLTLGVNDVGRMFTPDYLVVLNGPAQFKGDRYSFVERSRARAVFSHLDLRIDAPLVRFRLGRRGGVDLADPDTLPYTRNSPYVALCLAVFMGATHIGIIGVDFTPDHFFAATGVHNLASDFPRIDAEYTRLAAMCAAKGVEVVNLSPSSRLTAFPKVEMDTFFQRASPALRIVSYATTPVAGVPPILSRCITARTPHTCRTVWSTDSYGNGVAFEGDVEWSRDPKTARELVGDADLVIVHNGRIAPEHAPLFERKPTITLAHNYKWNVDCHLVDAGAPGLVVAQYQATLPEFNGWTPVANPLPLWEPEWQPAAKAGRLKIAYTPSGRHEKYPTGHRLYWHGKGYQTTTRILSELAKRHDIEVASIGRTQVSHAEALAMKRDAHIVIDECVTGSYHRNSLEGLAFGCVTVNGLGLVPEIRDMFLRCASASDGPFVRAGLDDLEAVLESLVAEGPAALVDRGARGRAWADRHWSFADQWATVWAPAVERALSSVPGRLDRAARSAPTPAPAVPAAAPTPGPLDPKAAPPARPGAARAPERAVAPPRRRPLPPVRRPRPAPRRPGMAPASALERDRDLAPLPRPGVTAVLAHGGANRARLPAATLAQLRACGEVERIVLVELDVEPRLPPEVSALVDTHLFVRARGAFNKGWALNVGTELVRSEFVLWLDSDLWVPPGFVTETLDEATARHLDCLIPWREVHYLTESDTDRVLAGRCEPPACTPSRSFSTRHGCRGGAVLVRRAFLEAFGGMDEGFRGWGGEDDAWFHKARTLGRASLSVAERHLFHLYHPLSAGYGQRGEHILANPHYPANVARLRELRALRTPEAFLARSQRRTGTPPWNGVRTVACPPGEVARKLRELCGDQLVVREPGEPADVAVGSTVGTEETVRAVIRSLAGEFGTGEG